MTDLLQAAFSPVNIVYTILLMVILLYWVSVILGALDIGAFDFDVDTDMDIEVDMEVDADLDADVDTDAEVSGGGVLLATLKFFNFGRVPFMVLMSFLIISLWALSILGNHHLSDGSIWFPFLIFIPILFISLIITKVVTTPLAGFFEKLNHEEEEINFIGKIGKVILPIPRGKLGQIEVAVNNSFITLDVIGSKKVSRRIDKGKEVLIVGQEASNNRYIVEEV